MAQFKYNIHYGGRTGTDEVVREVARALDGVTERQELKMHSTPQEGWTRRYVATGEYLDRTLALGIKNKHLVFNGKERDILIIKGALLTKIDGLALS